ncbi:MAG: FMN-binding protein [Defluviitaleaceae bacterium]|nr:FMN-binding protein [Defluviitaleaceae bacterium]
MKKIIHLSLFLGLVVGISTIALAFVNDLTAPIIAEAQDVLFAQQRQAAFPEATRHISHATDAPYTLEIIEALSGDTTLGYIYVQEIMGFADVVRYMLVIDTNGYIRNFLTLFNMETPGFAYPPRLYYWAEHQFMDQYLDTHIDTLAAATVTTAPIIEAIRHAYDDFFARR